MADTEGKVQDLVRKFEYAARVVESLHPDDQIEFIRKNSIADVMKTVDLEMIHESGNTWERHGSTMKKLEDIHQNGAKPHTIGPSRSKGRRNKVVRSKSLSFRRGSIFSSSKNKRNGMEKVETPGQRPIEKQSIGKDNIDRKIRGNLLAKENSIDEETADPKENPPIKISSVGEENGDPRLKGKFIAKGNSIDEESSGRDSEQNLANEKSTVENVNSQSGEKFLGEKNSTVENDHDLNGSSNLDSRMLKGMSKKKSISGTLKSFSSRLSTKRTKRKERQDVRCIEFDGDSVNCPDSDSVILGAENVRSFSFSCFIKLCSVEYQSLLSEIFQRTNLLLPCYVLTNGRNIFSRLFSTNVRQTMEWRQHKSHYTNSHVSFCPAIFQYLVKCFGRWLTAL